MKVKLIENHTTDEWLLKKHYAHRKCCRTYSMGLYVNNNLEGIVTYGSPSSPQVGRGFLGEENRRNVIELNRLCINSTAPKNSASVLISKSMKLIDKEKYYAVVSYTDEGQGHIGYVYQATNFLYCGCSQRNHKDYFYNGKWIHERTITSKGITSPVKWSKENNILTKPSGNKHRYIYFINKKKKHLLKYDVLPYPKGESKRYDCIDIKSNMNLFF